MGTQLNEQAYQKLIDENIAALNKHMPEHSLEKKHTIEVLKWSVKQIYHSGEAGRPDESSGLHLADVMVSGCQHNLLINGRCGENGAKCIGSSCCYWQHEP